MELRFNQLFSSHLSISKQNLLLSASIHFLIRYRHFFLIIMFATFFRLMTVHTIPILKFLHLSIVDKAALHILFFLILIIHSEFFILCINKSFTCLIILVILKHHIYFLHFIFEFIFYFLKFLN